LNTEETGKESTRCVFRLRQSTKLSSFNTPLRQHTIIHGR